MNTSQSLKERIVKGSLTTLFLTLLGSIFAYFIRILYSHTLSVENYGLFYATFGLFNMAISYTDLGFGYTIVYLLPKYLKLNKHSKAWNIYIYGQLISFTLSIIISLALIILAPFLAQNYFKVPSSENLIYIFCIYLVTFTFINGLIQIYTGMQREKYYSSITALRWFLTFIFSLLFFLFDFPNIIFYALSWAAGHIVTVLIFIFLLFKKHSHISKSKIVWDNTLFKQMFLLAYPVFLENFVYTFIFLADTFLLTLIKGVREVGVYNIIYPLASTPIILLGPINSLILPMVSHLMEGEKDKVKYIINRVLKIVPFIGIYFSLFIVIFPSAIIKLIFGQKWLGMTELPLMVLSVGIIALLTSNILGTITIGTGKVKERLKANTVAAVLSVATNFLLIWKYGVLGVVIANSIVGITLSLLFLRIIRSSVSFQIPYQFYFKILILSGAIYFTIKLVGFSPQNWLELIISGIIYTILFTLIGAVFKVYDRRFVLMTILRRKT